MGWTNRVVGLRDGQVVLDRFVADIKESDVRDVYRRVGSSNQLLDNSQSVNDHAH